MSATLYDREVSIVSYQSYCYRPVDAPPAINAEEDER